MIWHWGRSTVETNVAIYGGSFDPISTHHIKIGATVHSVLRFPIWYMPCWNHQYGKGLADSTHRLAMCRIACGKYEGFETCDFEIVNELSGSYFQTLSCLKETYPEIKFHTIIGTDNANDIGEGKWINGDQLIADNPFIVVDRGGHPLQADWCLHGHHKFFALGQKASATTIRKAIKEGDTNFVTENLDHDVWAYIQKEGLYL